MTEYYGAPKWFLSGMSGCGAELLNAVGSRHYMGWGYDKKKRTWTDGVLLTDFAYTMDFWEKKRKGADFVIHFAQRRPCEKAK
jgi:hypothetical protein